MERSRSRSKCNSSLASDLTDQLVVVKSGVMMDESDDGGPRTIPAAAETTSSPLSPGSAPVGRLLPSPDDKRVDSFTCSCSSAGDKSFTDGGVKSLDTSTDEASPQSILTVEMFSHFATEYTHPIDGDSDISSRDDSCDICDRRGQSARSGSGIVGEIFLDEDRSCEENDASPPATNKSIDSKLKSDDGERSKVDNHRRHRRISSMPASLSMVTSTTKTPERMIHSGPDEGYPSRHIPVTPSPPHKKPPSHIRSRSMPVADLCKIYGNNIPAIASSFEFQSSPDPQSHHRIVSAHTPLGDIMKLNGNPNITRRRAGLPPRPTGTVGGSGRTSPVSRKASLTFETPAPSHRRVNSEPGVGKSLTEGGRPVTPILCDKPATLHLRASSYGSFRAIRDASELLYNLQNSSPDPKLLGRRQRHQRSPSFDSRTTLSAGDNTKDGTDESSGEEESSAEQCWNAYYEKRKLKKNIVKEELKYRLGRRIPKALTTRKSAELKPASSAKFC
mmetsp:Transcript_17853/g.38761  ORF Transcript_17853/g.38761 Transcript_17853/m.38761 type:complete len:503 (-) Transcript_17853:86-1594(-)